MTRPLRLAFWAAALGALVFNYPHLVTWFRQWTPAGWAWTAYGAAGMLDWLILACFYAQDRLPPGARPAALDRALATGVGLSFYVNLRYGLAATAWEPLPDWALRWADLLIGAGAGPVLAWMAHDALDSVTRVMEGRAPRQSRQPQPQAARPAPGQAQPPTRSATAPRTSGGRLAPSDAVALYLELQERHGGDKAAMAEEAGRDVKTIERWGRMARLAA